MLRELFGIPLTLHMPGNAKDVTLYMYESGARLWCFLQYKKDDALPLLRMHC